MESVRHQLDDKETMLKFYGEIERMVFSAETYCEGSHKIHIFRCTGNIKNCPFHRNKLSCSLKSMRELLGEP